MVNKVKGKALFHFSRQTKVRSNLAEQQKHHKVAVPKSLYGRHFTFKLPKVNNNWKK